MTAKQFALACTAVVGALAVIGGIHDVGRPCTYSGRIAWDAGPRAHAPIPWVAPLAAIEGAESAHAEVRGVVLRFRDDMPAGEMTYVR
jgi:hypothetical protein